MRQRLLRVRDWEAIARQSGFDPAQLAAACFVSQRQLERFFATQFRTTPRDWLLRLRCQMASELIARGYSTKAVARELNFSNEQIFCRAFKKIYCVPPQTFAPGNGDRHLGLSLDDNNVAS
jgi:AraC-like DNA-binding protein